MVDKKPHYQNSITPKQTKETTNSSGGIPNFQETRYNKNSSFKKGRVFVVLVGASMIRIETRKVKSDFQLPKRKTGDFEM